MYEVLVISLFVIAAVIGYFLPALIASRRHHQQANAICILNLLLGWTFVGWAVAAVWAFTSVDARKHP